MQLPKLKQQIKQLTDLDEKLAIENSEAQHEITNIKLQCLNVEKDISELQLKIVSENEAKNLVE